MKPLFRFVLFIGMLLLFYFTVTYWGVFQNFKFKLKHSEEGISVTIKYPSSYQKLKNNSVISTAKHECGSSLLYDSSSKYTFQPVGQKNKNMFDYYIYSAFYDVKLEVVVIISLKLNNGKDLFCSIWYGNKQKIVKGKQESTFEGESRLYNANFIKCPFPNKLKRPKFISVSESKCAGYESFLKINIIPERVRSDKFAVCVPPLNMKYDDVYRFIEMVSMNQVLGADKIFFYNYSIGPRVNKIIKSFQPANLITVLPWNLPMKVNVYPVPPNHVVEIKYFGQVAMNQDCLYRTKGFYKYTVICDMDEFLIPRTALNWRQLFKEVINVKYNPNAAGWLFRNVFFGLGWPNDPKIKNDTKLASSKVLSMLKIRRGNEIFPAYQRSKLIVNPLMVYNMGIHNVWSNEGKVSILDPEDGLLHHYRVWGSLPENYVVDTNAWRLKSLLESQLRQTYFQANLSIV